MNVTEQMHFQEKCSGCFACASVCPTDAIKMEQNKEGFYYPKLKADACIDCKKCLTVCSVSNREKDFLPQAAYSYQGTDEIRAKSSSGGLFHQCAVKVLEEGGIVFGAIYDFKRKTVCHASTDQVSLDEIMRSKYVQSEMGTVYQEVRKELADGRVVLFCGTPCQVYGLKSFLGKEEQNLITIDFVCHGVPSNGFFTDMVKNFEEKEQANVINVTFREKDLGWRKQMLKVYFDNGNVSRYQGKEEYYYYYYYYLSNIILRKSCYSCEFPQNHISDITVMDYWQISDDDNKGVSACTVNSEKGDRFIRFACGGAATEIDLSKINGMFRQHSDMNDYRTNRFLRDQFMSYYAKNGFEKTLRRLNTLYHIILNSKGKIRIYGGKIKSKLKQLRK